MVPDCWTPVSNEVIVLSKILLPLYNVIIIYYYCILNVSRSPRVLDLFLPRKSYSTMKSLIILLIGLVFVVEGSIEPHVKVGDYAQVLNMVEKVFVDTSGTARKIWKGGVVVRDDPGDGKCHITKKN